MDFRQAVEEIGCWKREKVLGSGGFGYVILWRNKETNEMFALKECRWGHDSMMTPKNRNRWKLEVDMMLRLNHPNVVKAFPVPSELNVPATELPLLAMEYCSGGDLRKLLNKPENCCGLSEKHVRLLLRHVSSALNYLHSKRIIHRDLKPENIVIQDINGKVMYKLIDLGYAKELDQGSLCTSFVGTLQYLAPELFMSQKYSCTVDYWSFGLVTYEIITGLRPFLPDKAPPEWIPIIKQKGTNVIRAYLDDDKNVAFSSEISPLHQICSILKKDIETWLQLMLEWDPKKRGKRENITAYSLLETFLNKKVVLIFCVETFKLLSLTIDENDSLNAFQKCIESQTGIPLQDQEILLPKGKAPDQEKGMVQFVSNLEEDEMMVFLFNKNSQLLSPSSNNIFIPPSVENMMRNPREAVKYPEQRAAWSEAVYLSHQELLLLNRLVLAFKANLMNLLSKISHAKKNTSSMTSEMNKLIAKCSFFKNSLKQDIENYEQETNGSFVSKLMLDCWKNSHDNLKNIDVLQQKVIALEASSNDINACTVELQRSSYARSKHTNPLEDTYCKVLEAFADLRRRPKDQRKIPHDNTDMVRLMCLCLKHRESQIHDVTSHIKKINQVKRELDDVQPQIEHLLKEISDWDAQVDNWQFKRQQDVWEVVNSLNIKIKQMERSLSPGPNSSFPKYSVKPAILTKPPRINSIGSHTVPRSSPQVINGHQYNRNYQLPISRVAAPVIPLNSRLETEFPFTNSIRSANAFPNLLSQNSPSSLVMASTDQSFPMERHQDTSLVDPSPVALSSILEKTADDSRRIKQENQDLVTSFQNMIEFMKDSLTNPELSFGEQEGIDSNLRQNPD